MICVVVHPRLTNAQPVDPTITGYTIRDLRFPTSLDAIGSDPMKWVVRATRATRCNMLHAADVASTSGENAHGYIVYHTDTDLQGIGWSFSNGQGNE
jgi:L-galactonate dehydratase